MSGYADTSWRSAPSYSRPNWGQSATDEADDDRRSNWGQPEQHNVAYRKLDNRISNRSTHNAEFSEDVEQHTPTEPTLNINNLFILGFLAVIAGAVLLASGFVLGYEFLLWSGMGILGLGLMFVALFVIDDGSRTKTFV